MSYKLSIVELILLVNRKVEYILLHLGEKNGDCRKNKKPL